VNTVHSHSRFTSRCVSRVEPTSPEVYDRDADGNATSQKERADFTEITDNDMVT
jgi:hypothetical protein